LSYKLENLKKRKSRKIASYDKKLLKFYQEKPLADVTFIVKGKEILAHKTLLAAKCPYFCNMFLSLFVEIL